MSLRFEFISANLASDELLRMEELSELPSSYFVYYSRLQVQEHRPRDVFSGPSFTEEGVEGVITAPFVVIRRHVTVRLDAMLHAVKFPAGVTDLDTGLSEMYRDAFTLKKTDHC